MLTFSLSTSSPLAPPLVTVSTRVSSGSATLSARPATSRRCTAVNKLASARKPRKSHSRETYENARTSRARGTNPLEQTRHEESILRFRERGRENGDFRVVAEEREFLLLLQRKLGKAVYARASRCDYSLRKYGCNSRFLLYTLLGSVCSCNSIHVANISGYTTLHLLHATWTHTSRTLLLSLYTDIAKYWCLGLPSLRLRHEYQPIAPLHMTENAGMQYRIVC